MRRASLLVVLMAALPAAAGASPTGGTSVDPVSGPGTASGGTEPPAVRPPAPVTAPAPVGPETPPATVVQPPSEPVAAPAVPAAPSPPVPTAAERRFDSGRSISIPEPPVVADDGGAGVVAPQTAPAARAGSDLDPLILVAAALALLSAGAAVGGAAARRAAKARRLPAPANTMASTRPRTGTSTKPRTAVSGRPFVPLGTVAPLEEFAAPSAASVVPLSRELAAS